MAAVTPHEQREAHGRHERAQHRRQRADGTPGGGGERAQGGAHRGGANDERPKNVNRKDEYTAWAIGTACNS